MTEEELPPEETIDEEPVTETVSTTSDSMEREIKNLTAMMAQQSRQLSSLTKTVTELVTEVKAMKGS